MAQSAKERALHIDANPRLKPRSELLCGHPNGIIGRVDLVVTDLRRFSCHFLCSSECAEQEKRSGYGEGHHDPLSESILKSKKPPQPIPSIWYAIAIVSAIVGGSAAVGHAASRWVYKRRGDI